MSITDIAASLAEASVEDEPEDPSIRRGYGRASAQDGGGTIIPSAKSIASGGGSHGFSVDDEIPVFVDPHLPGKRVTTRSEILRGQGRLPQAPEPAPAPVPATPRQDVSPVPVVPQPVEVPAAAPDKRLVVLFGGAMGELETYYHDIFRAGVQLVLCWDTRYKGQRYRPSPGDEPLHMRVGQDEEPFTVLSKGLSFKHHGYEYTILLIDEVTHAEVPAPQESDDPPVSYLGAADPWQGVL